MKAEQDVLPKEFVIRLLGADGLQEAVEAGLRGSSSSLSLCALAAPRRALSCRRR